MDLLYRLGRFLRNLLRDRATNWNGNLEMKNIIILSDFEFDQIAPDISLEARASAWELWRDDLTTALSRDQLIIGANSILYYFGSKVLITDVDRSAPDNCFLWEVEQDQ